MALSKQPVQNWLLFGQPGSGKTTLAKEMQRNLWDCELIDGDDIRALTTNINYGRDGRIANITNAALIAKYLNSRGTSVIISVVAPYKELRDILRKELPGLICVYMYYDRYKELRGRECYWVDDFENLGDHDHEIDSGMMTVQLSCRHLIQTSIKKRFNGTTETEI